MPTKSATQTASPSATATRPDDSMSPAAVITEDVPRPLSPDELTASAAVTAPAVEPRLHPPGSPGAAAAMSVDGIAAWKLDARVGALWTSNNARNAWVWVNGVGWKKLAGTTDQAHLSMYELARLARDTNAAVNYRDEADGQIHELYVW